MIDWLEEVLKAAQSEEKQNRLLELLGQTGAVAAAKRTAAAEEEEPVQREDTDTLASSEGKEILSVGTEDSRFPLSNRKEAPAGSPEGGLSYIMESLASGSRMKVQDPLISQRRTEQDVWAEYPEDRGSAVSAFPRNGGFTVPAEEESALLSQLRDAVDSAALYSPRRVTGSSALYNAGEVMGSSVLIKLARRALGQMLPEQGRRDTGEQFGGVEPMSVAEDSMLRSLYRRTVEAVQGYQTAERAGSPLVIREEQVVTTGLTAQELDRAVRRDSRRYDGGMNIY